MESTTGGVADQGDSEDSGSLPAAHRRIHYSVLALLYLGVLVLAGVALGSFGASETSVHNFVEANYPPEHRANDCILYARYLGDDGSDEVPRPVAMSSKGSCTFVIVGQVAVFVVVLVWFIFSICQLVLLKPDM